MLQKLHSLEQTSNIRTDQHIKKYTWMFVIWLVLCAISQLLYPLLPSIEIKTITNWIIWIPFVGIAFLGVGLWVYGFLSLLVTFLVLYARKPFLWFIMLSSLGICIFLIGMLVVMFSRTGTLWSMRSMLILLPFPLIVSITSYKYLFKIPNLSSEDIINTEITKK